MTESKIPYMAFYPQSYLADTRHFTLEEHGAYILLISQYWLDGGLPADDERLAEIVAIPVDQWLKIKPRVARKFSSDWKHKRIETELEIAREKYQRRARAGSLGGKARPSVKDPGNAGANSSNAKAMQNNAGALLSNKKRTDQIREEEERNARERASVPGLQNDGDHLLNSAGGMDLSDDAPPSSNSLTVPKKSPRSIAAQAMAHGAMDFATTFWPRYPHKVGKPDALKAFQRQIQKGISVGEIMDGLERYIRDKPADRQWLNPATFLNGARFADEPAPVQGSAPRTGRDVAAKMLLDMWADRGKGPEASHGSELPLIGFNPGEENQP